MEISNNSFGHFSENSDDEEEFCSCCADDEGWLDNDELMKKEPNEDVLDEFSLKMFFKGVSVCQSESSASGLSGIGVIMERCPGVPIIEIQKKLDFFVEKDLAELLALMDGLMEAQRNGTRRIFAFTDSDIVHCQISGGRELEDPLLAAFGERVLEYANTFEQFVLKLIPSPEINRAFLLAQEAIGILCSSGNVNRTVYCPFPDCAALLSSHEFLSTRQSSLRLSGANDVECPECMRLLCAECVVPWHASMSCEEYQNLPAEERASEDVIFNQMARDNNWKRCERCRRMIELTQGCYHMTCWCGHEFCYSCGFEYRDGHQTCQCAYHEDEILEPVDTAANQDAELWRWESFELPPSTMDAYTEQERSQLALIQRFLAGSFGLSDHNPCPSPPRCSDSFVDTIKDLHQLPWLERFVSVISDNYHEDYMQ